MKLQITTDIDLEEVAKSLKDRSQKEAHAAVDSFLAGLDTDSYIYAREWIAENPLDSTLCPRCKRHSFVTKLTDHRCEYCRQVLA